MSLAGLLATMAKRGTMGVMFGRFSIKMVFATALLTALPCRADRLVLIGGGDVAYPSGWFDKQIARKGDRLFQYVRPLLKRAHLRFLNLESPVTTAKSTAKKSYPLVTHPRFLRFIVDAGFNLFSLANNHTGDAGKIGVIDTFKHLGMEAARVGRSLIWAGAGLTLQSRAKPAIFTPRGSTTKVAFLAFRLSGSRFGNPMGKHAAEQQIRSAARRADIVIVSAHGGAEYTYRPGGWKVKRWRSFIDAGAHVVLGHGPHNPQGVERYKHGVIYYSLGNLSFGTRPGKRRTGGMLLRGLMARVTWDGGRLVKAEAIPLFVDNVKPWVAERVKVPVRRFVPYPVTGPHARVMLDELRNWSSRIRGNRTRISPCNGVYCLNLEARNR